MLRLAIVDTNSSKDLLEKLLVVFRFNGPEREYEDKNFKMCLARAEEMNPDDKETVEWLAGYLRMGYNPDEDLAPKDDDEASDGAPEDRLSALDDVMRYENSDPDGDHSLGGDQGLSPQVDTEIRSQNGDAGSEKEADVGTKAGWSVEDKKGMRMLAWLTCRRLRIIEGDKEINDSYWYQMMKMLKYRDFDP